MLVAGRDGSVRVLDLDTGELGPVAGRREPAVAAAAFTPDRRRAVTAGADGRAIVSDVRRATTTDTLAGHASSITALAITRDNSTLYTAGLDGEVLAWDLAGTRRPRQTPLPSRAARAWTTYPSLP